MNSDPAKIEPLLTEAEVSDVLKVPSATLANWRSKGHIQGLPFVKVGGGVRYRRADVESFIQGNVTQPGATF